MKKILILILTVCSITGYGQTQLNPSGSNSVANINTALTMPAVAAGTDTYTTTIIGATLTTNKAYTILFTNACTGTPTPTININDGTNNLGAVTLKKFSSGSLVNLSAGDISNGQPIRFRYNGTNFVMEGGTGSGGTSLNGTGYVKMSGTTTSYNTTIPNADLTNSSITIAGNATSLGGSVTQDNITGLSSTGIIKRTAANTLGIATSGTDYEVPLTFSTGLTRSTNAITVNTSQNITTLSGLTSNGFLTTSGGTGALSITIPGTGITTWIATPSSANLAAAVNDETGTGALVFGTTPTIATPVINGLPTGTGVSSTASVSTLASRDANANTAANNYTPGYTTTATAAGTTTLTVSSTRKQVFTGSTTQTLVLPVVSTLPQTNFAFTIINNSTGAVTVQSSGANTIQVMAANSTMEVYAILLTGTSASSWQYQYYPSNPATTTGDTYYANSSGEPQKLAIGSTNDIYTVVAGIPAWSTGTPGVTTNSNASSGKVGEYVSSLIAVGSATSFTTATAKNVTSISLTAGDWDVYGNVTFTEGSATVTARTAGISSTSATLPTDGSEIEMGTLTTVVSEKVTLSIPTKRVSIASTTTIYLVGSTTFSAGTSSGYGFIGARRAR